MSTTTTSTFRRPGVSDEYLTAAGCRHVGEEECARLYGFKAAGIAIPFFDLRGETVTDEKPFARVRLYDATTDQKYSQRHGSTSHLYIPHSFKDTSKGCTLVLVEGEFKSMALAEAGFAALGLNGITGAARTSDGEKILHEELADIVKVHQPARIVFLGDSDVVFNSQFTFEAAKLRPLLCGNRRFPFVQNFLVAKPPVDGPKGIDDCRQEKGDQFNPWLEALLQGAMDIPTKATAADIFCELLRREIEPVKKVLSAGTQDARHVRRKLLRSANFLWNETGAKLDLKPLLAEALNVNESEVSGLVRDAEEKKPALAIDASSSSPLEDDSLVSFPDVEPWDKPVALAELLNQIAVIIETYVIAPEPAVIAAALFVVHSYAYDLGDVSPILFITGPTKRCGKSKFLAVLLRMVCRPFAASSASAAGFYRVIELFHPTLLIDEVDSFMRENEQLRGLVNSGHTRDAAFHLGCVTNSDNEIEPRRWSTWTPKIFSGIGRLADTIEDRAVIIRMERRRKNEPVERLKHKMQFPDVPRKALRFVNDLAETIRNANPTMPDTLNDRAADNWTPLFALADLAGGDWPAKTRHAAVVLSSGDDALGANVQLLADIQDTFNASGEDKLASKDLAERLAQMEGRPWAEFGKHRRPLSSNQLANLLRGFGVSPRTVRVENNTPRGYAIEDFTDAFSRYLPQIQLPKCNNATSAANIGENGVFQGATLEACCTSKNAIPTNKDGQCCTVALQTAEKEAELL